MSEATSFACTGCGHRFEWRPGGPLPFSCPASLARDDIDHVVRPVLPAFDWNDVDTTERQPFLRYRRRLSSYHLAREAGMGDATFCAMVRGLDAAVARVDGQGLLATPFAIQGELGHRLGLESPDALWMKDETRNVSGSHKGRHLFGLLIHLRVAAWRGASSAGTAPRLAIASCGNAALAAAVLARAAGMPVEVFIPPSANPAVIARLRALGAGLTVCERRPGEAGDPCYLRFREARDAGAVPFCCQGPDNGLTIEGGKTLAWEAIEALGGRPIDRLFLQVGGGAFASACAQGFAEAVEAGVLPALPRIHAVQTKGAHPLERAYAAIAARLLPEGELRLGPADVARQLAAVPRSTREAAFSYAAMHRHEFMQPWPTEPHSIAHGILDDETYDWRAIVEAMAESGGWPLVVWEDQLRRANDLAREATGSDVDHTGSAGLAGLLSLVESPAEDLSGDLRSQRSAVVFTGARRDA